MSIATIEARMATIMGRFGSMKEATPLGAPDQAASFSDHLDVAQTAQTTGTTPITRGKVSEPSDALREVFEKAAEETGLDVELLLAVAWTESRWNQQAESDAGAIGMMQLMPATAAELGVNPFDLVENIKGGARYLAQQIEAFGSIELGLAAYNAGPGRVRAAGGIPAIAETQSYVRLVMSRMAELLSGAIAGGSSVPSTLETWPLITMSPPASVSTDTAPNLATTPTVASDVVPSTNAQAAAAAEPSDTVSARTAQPTIETSPSPDTPPSADTATSPQIEPATDASSPVEIRTASTSAPADADAGDVVDDLIVAQPRIETTGTSTTDVAADASVTPSATLAQTDTDKGDADSTDAGTPQRSREASPIAAFGAPDTLGESVATGRLAEATVRGVDVIAAASPTAPAAPIDGSSVDAPVSLSQLPLLIAQRAGQGTQTVVIHLDPPELGRLTLRLVTRGEDVLVSMSAASPDAIPSLQGLRGAVNDALQGQGFGMGGFDVGGQQDNSEDHQTQSTDAVVVAQPEIDEVVEDGALRL